MSTWDGEAPLSRGVHAFSTSGSDPTTENPETSLLIVSRPPGAPNAEPPVPRGDREANILREVYVTQLPQPTDLPDQK